MMNSIEVYAPYLGTMNAKLNIIHPTLLLDTWKCRRNIDRMCAKMQHNGIQFRPHFKTHQSREIGRWFRDYGVDKITVSSLRMALYFADDGWDDITVAFPVNILEKDIINALAGRITLNLLAEDPEVINQLDTMLQHEVNLFLKIDTGTHRTGIDPVDLMSIDRCIEAIRHSRYLRWKGFLAHAGHTYRLRHRQPVIQNVYADSLVGLFALRDHYRVRHPDILISFGDTPGASMMEDLHGIDEMRPGNFVFYDTMQVQIGSCHPDEIAVAMICPVVATHLARNEVIIYGGGIHFAKDSIVLEDQQLSFGTMVVYADGMWVADNVIGNVRSLSQEHGIVQVSDAWIDKIRPGALVSILPVHSCMTAQCMGYYNDQEGRSIDHFAGSPYSRS